MHPISFSTSGRFTSLGTSSVNAHVAAFGIHVAANQPNPISVTQLAHKLANALGLQTDGIPTLPDSLAPSAGGLSHPIARRAQPILFPLLVRFLRNWIDISVSCFA